MSKTESTSHTPETDNEAYMVECTSVQNYGIEDPSEVVDAGFARKLERQRNELLEALKDLMYWDNGKPEWEAARAAIAKVEGKA